MKKKILSLAVALLVSANLICQQSGGASGQDTSSGTTGKATKSAQAGKKKARRRSERPGAEGGTMGKPKKEKKGEAPGKEGATPGAVPDQDKPKR